MYLAFKAFLIALGISLTGSIVAMWIQTAGNEILLQTRPATKTIPFTSNEGTLRCYVWTGPSVSGGTKNCGIGSFFSDILWIGIYNTLVLFLIISPVGLAIAPYATILFWSWITILSIAFYQLRQHSRSLYLLSYVVTIIGTIAFKMLT